MPSKIGPDGLNLTTGRRYLWFGLALGVASLLLFFLHLQLKQVFVPWYVPIVCTLGAALVLVSIFQRRTIPRYAALVIVALLGGMEWYLLGVIAKLPEYRGPAVAGKRLPDFTTTLADGRPFTDEDLLGPQATVLTFFRGRW
jgi:hypothetical protein